MAVTTREFGPYLLGELLGSGGMGEVYRARDTRRDRWVALKLLPDLFRDDHEYQARFRRESLVAARLSEPHVIPIHDYGEIDGRLFIDMRLVDGGDLGSLLARHGALDPHRAVGLVGQVADALDAAHAAGLVHRDVKPSNVLVTANDFVYVVDFGVARSIGLTSTSLTITGTTVGTLEYMAPERFTNRPIDGRADVYSLSCVLAECLTGRRPFGGEDLPALMYAHLYSEPVAPSSMVPVVPAALDAVVLRGMAKRPEDRYATAGEFAAAAREALGGTASWPVPPPAAPPAVTRAPAGTRGPAPGDAGPAAGGSRVRPAPPAPRPPVEAGSALTTVPGPGGAGDGREPSPGRRRRGLRVGALALAGAVVVGGGVYGGLQWAGSGTTAAGTATSAGSTTPAGSAGSASGTAAPVTPGPTAAPPVRPVASLATPTAGAAIPVPPSPQYMAIAPNGRFAYITHPKAGLVSVFDTTLDAVTATIPIPDGPPMFVTFAPDGARAYVTVTDRATHNAVDILDTRTNRVLKSIPTGKGPFAPAVSPDGRRLYVPLHDEHRVDVIDTGSGAVVAGIEVPPNPHWIALSADGSTGYTADHESNLVAVLDLRSNTVLTTIPVGRSPHSITFSPDHSRVTLVCFDSNEVYEIDPTTNRVVADIKDIGAKPQDVVYAPDGAHFYTANVDDGTVSVVDAATGAITARIPTGASPTSIAVLPDGRQAFVTNLDDATVRILDIGVG